MLVDYGFSISGTRKVALFKNDTIKLSVIFNTILTSKILLCCLALIIIGILATILKLSGYESLMILLSSTILIGQIVLPNWFLQGVENMETVALFNFLSKCLLLISILVFINDPTDSIWVNFILGISNLIAGIAILCLSIYRYKLIIRFPPYFKIVHEILNSKRIFLSSIFVYASNNSTLFILGLFASPTTLGVYGIIDKFILVFRAPAILLYHSIYPHACSIAEESMDKLQKFLKSLSVRVSLLFIPICLSVYYLSDYMIYYFVGYYEKNAIYLLEIVSVVPLLSVLTVPTTIPVLAANFQKIYLKITLIILLANALVSVLLISNFIEKGAAISVLCAEAFTIITYSWFNHKIYKSRAKSE